jgi:hypothetical protein
MSGIRLLNALKDVTSEEFANAVLHKYSHVWEYTSFEGFVKTKYPNEYISAVTYLRLKGKL